MNKESKVKKGMTLIEVIISVALLSILIIPLSNIVISSLQNNIKSEEKQKASYIGQKVLEELKAYDEIILKEENEKKYFELLDGDKILKNEELDLYEGSFQRTIYGPPSNSEESKEDIFNVTVELEKDSIFQYDNFDNLNENNNSDFNLTLLKENNMYKLNLDSEPSIGGIVLSNTLIIEINENSDKVDLKVVDKDTNTEIISVSKDEAINNIIILNLNSNYDKENIIEIKNYLSESIEIYVIKDKNSLGNLNLLSIKGDVIIYEENRIDENSIVNMYNYKITVKDDKGNVIFEGNSSKNMNIK